MLHKIAYGKSGAKNICGRVEGYPGGALPFFWPLGPRLRLLPTGRLTISARRATMRPSLARTRGGGAQAHRRFSMSQEKMNLDIRLENGKLHLVIDMDRVQAVSSKGNPLIASTRGWVPIAPGISLSLNLVKKRGM